MISHISHQSKKHQGPARRPHFTSRYEQFWHFCRKVLVIIIGILCLIFLAIFFGIWVFLYLNNDIKTSYTVLFTNNKIDGQKNPIILATKNILSHKIDIYIIDGQLEREVSGYGKYRFEAIYPLLVQEQKNHGQILNIISQSSDTLVDEVIVAPSRQIDSKHDLSQYLLMSIPHNLSPTKLLFISRLFWLVNGLDQGNLIMINITSAQDLEKNLAKMALAEKDDCSISLDNQGKIQGLASKLGQLLENSGYQVVRTTSEYQPESLSEVIYDEACHDTAERIRASIMTDAKFTIDDQVMNLYRSHIHLKIR